MADGDNTRITVSEDRLRGVIAEFELRLRDFIETKLERKADLVILTEARKELTRHGERLDALERFQHAVPGAAVVSALAAVAAALITLFH